MESFHFKKKLDTIKDHHNKHTLEDQCCSWATPSKNCLGAVFVLGFNKTSYILFHVQTHVASIH